MTLISRQDFIDSSVLRKLPFPFLRNWIVRFTALPGINQRFEQCYRESPEQFIDLWLEQMGIRLKIDDSEIEQIPSQGGCLLVYNQPFGGLEQLLIQKIVQPIRRDLLMAHITPDAEITSTGNLIHGFELSEGNLWQSHRRCNHLLQCLQEGALVALHPTRPHQRMGWMQKQLTEQAWHPLLGKLALEAQVPIVPIYFSVHLSKWFQFLHRIDPSLAKLRQPTELLAQHRYPIQIRVGNTIPAKELSSLEKDDLQVARYLRARTIALGSTLPPQKTKWKRTSSFHEIIPPVSVEWLQKDLEEIRGDALLFTFQQFEVFLCASARMPNIIREIGRLREITFREVGEGSGQSVDLDAYDPHYLQLFIWDKDNRQIAGGYRMGRGDLLLQLKGIKGFYIHSLFRFKPEFASILSKSAELGRSFITQPYQQQRWPLFLLWKGILTFMQLHPHLRYLIGPVSISNRFAPVSRSLMIRYIRLHHFNESLAAWVKPRHPFKLKDADRELEPLLGRAMSSIQELERLLSDIDPTHMKLPVLLKKYIRQNAQILGFNVDPQFSDALDGLMLLDMKDLPPDMLSELQKEKK